MRVSDGKSCGDGDAKRDDVAEAPGMRRSKEVARLRITEGR